MIDILARHRIPSGVIAGQNRVRLRWLAEKIDPAVAPVLSLLTVTRALWEADEKALAERLLRAALTARPREVVLYHKLGQLLTEQEPPRWTEAVECYRAARALRPDLGVTLAMALLRVGRDQESLELFSQLVLGKPDNPYLYFQRGYVLRVQEKYMEAELDDCFGSLPPVKQPDAYTAEAGREIAPNTAACRPTLAHTAAAGVSGRTASHAPTADPCTSNDRDAHDASCTPPEIIAAGTRTPQHP